MKRSIWLTYDLGVKGDYQNLYSWLDDHEAVSCGNNVAYFVYQTNAANDKELADNLREDLKKKVSFQPGDRIYIIRKKDEEGEQQTVGSFLIGKRKASPWEGYGQKEDETQEVG